MSSRPRLVTLICTCATIVGVCCPATANAVERPAVSTSGHRGVELAPAAAHHRQGQRTGSVTRTPSVSVAISLRERHTSKLSAFIRELDTPGSPEYRHPLTPAQFRARFSPTPAQANRVVRFLRQRGFREVALTRNRLFVTARASMSTARRAFGVRLKTFRDAGRAVYANLNAPTLPPAIGGSVRAVLGLSDFSGFVRPMQAKDFTATAPPNCTLVPGSAPKPWGSCYYTPSSLRTAYDTGTLTGAGVPIAIMAQGNPAQTVRDLRSAEAAFGEPAVPTTIERVGRPGADLSGTDEWDLDTQYATAMAPGVSRLYLYVARTLDDANVALELNRWVSQDLTRAASASFGECELLPHSDGTMAAGDEIMTEAAAQGQTLFVAAGDGGGQRCKVYVGDHRTRTLHDVNYPCSSTYVVCVGGTSLFTNADGSYQQELAWHAGGGGTSSFEPMPPWQNCMGGVSDHNTLHGEPDIAMDAGINTGAVTFIGGAPGELGGTSLSAPLALGAWADIESAAGDTLGPASQLLYRLYPSSPCTSVVPTPPSAPLGTASSDPAYPFHDVYLGSNGTYPAVPGWDYATGLGSFDVAKVSAALAALTPPPPS